MTLPPARDPAAPWEVLGLMVALTLGGLVRLSYVLAADFPLHDGGLFYVMARDVQQAGYALPAYTTYNDAAIPFAYPPLGFYSAAALDSLTSWSLDDAFRVLPLVVNWLTIGAFWLLSRALVRALAPSRIGDHARSLAVACATVAFALLPRGFEWLIMGGGVTRALGFLFAVLTMWSAHGLYTRGGVRTAVLTAVCGAGTVLSHPEMAWFAAYSVGLLFLAFGRTRRAVALSTAVGAAVVALTAPWWALVLLRHGLAPLRASGQAGWDASGLLSLARFTLTDERYFPLLGALALLGLLLCLAMRQLLLPAWVLAICVLGPRSSHTVSTVPLALLAGAGAAWVVWPLLGGERSAALAASAAPDRGERASVPGADATFRPDSDRIGARDPEATRSGAEWRRAVATAVVATGLLYATVTAAVGAGAFLVPLAADERAAMAWVAADMPPAAAFLVITGDRWAADKPAEWFPALAGRRSVATVQGTEWVDGGFWPQVARNAAVQRCAQHDADCLERWRAVEAVPFTHVYVSKHATVDALGRPAARDECCAPLRASLAADPRYRLAHDGGGAAIFVRVE